MDIKQHSWIVFATDSRYYYHIVHSSNRKIHAQIRNTWSFITYSSSIDHIDKYRKQHFP